MQLSHTPQSGVTLKHIEGWNGWLGRHVSSWQHISPDGAQVGPQYPTQAEALADTADYVRRAGWTGSAPVAASPMLQALKLAAEAFYRRDKGTGLNSWDYDAWKAAKAAVKAETGEVFNGSAWVKPL